MRAAAILAAIFGTAVAGWTALASAILCKMASRMEMFVFPWDQWWTSLFWFGANWWATLCVVASAAIPTALTIAIGVVAISWRWRRRRRIALPRGRGHRPIVQGTTDNFGHARILTAKESLQRYPGPTGVVIGELSSGKAGTAPLVIDPSTAGAGHGMLIAGTRAGKTTSAVVSLLYWPSSAVVLDPSAEMGGMLEHALREDGKTVHLLNPETAKGFNALDWIDINRPLAAMDVRAVIAWVFPPDEQKGVQTDAYFSPSGKALATCILAHLLWSTRPAEEKTLATFRTLVVTPEAEMPDLLADIHASSNSPLARDIAGTLMKVTPRQFSGIYGQCVMGSDWLSNPELATLVSGNSFCSADIINGRTVVFAQVPLHTLEQTPGCSRVIIGALMQAVYNARGQINGRVLALLDEAWSLGPMAIQRSALVAGAKSGLQLVFLYQAIGQIQAVWGEAGVSTLYNNLEWRAYAACRDDKTAEEVSKAFGEISVVAYTDGESVGSQRAFMSIVPGSRSSGDMANRSEIRRRLVLPQEVLDAPRDELFVVARGNMRLRMPVYFLRLDLARRVVPSQYYRAAE
jgi:type IV secretion system protein VirD4